MARKAVMDKVTAIMAAQWSHCPVYGPNTTTETPQDGSSFIIVQYPYARAQQMSFGDPGNNNWRDEGAFRFVIHVPWGEGIDEGSAWADELAAMFRGRDFAVFKTWAPSAPATDDRNSAANYYVLSIAVPYWHDYLG